MTAVATPRTVVATVSAHLCRSALRVYADRGLDWATEARRVGVPPTLAPDFRWRVPLAAVVRLFDRGIERFGPDFPVLAGRHPPDAHTSPVALYCRTREDVRQGLRGLVEHYPLLTDGWRLSFDGERLRWHADDPPAALWWCEVVDLLQSARDLLPGLPPLAIHTSLPAPPGLRLLPCVVAEGPGLAVAFPRVVLDRKLPTADPSVRALLDRQIAELRAEQPVAAIRGAVRALGPTATLEAVAGALGISTRTLHRRLQEAGTSFRGELDQVRAERAEALVGRVSFDEAAELLGYSDARALRRALRRWSARRGLTDAAGPPAR